MKKQLNNQHQQKASTVKKKAQTKKDRDTKKRPQNTHTATTKKN